MEIAKFKKLKAQRQAELVLEKIKAIEKVWTQEKAAPKKALLELGQHLLVFSSEVPSPSPNFWKLSAHRLVDMDLRSFLDLSVPLERFCQKSLTDHDLLPISEGDLLSKESLRFPLVLVLDHLRSAFNVGAIFRSAECLGVEHIYLVGYTPTPEDARVQKTSMGTHAWVPWSYFPTSDEAYQSLRNKNYQLVGFETAQSSQDICDFEPKKPLALVLGNERFGLLPKNLQALDHCVQVPMRGKKNSMNVASLASVAIHWITHQWQSKES